MNIQNRFDYKSLSRTTNKDGTRYYICPETGKRVPSVTTILSKTSHKPELEAWIARVGEVQALRERKEAGDLGSLMHTHLESHIQGIERPKGTNLVRQMATNMADQVINRGMKDIEEVWGWEIGLYFPTLYAGTTDLIGVYKGRPAIIDYKTTKKPKTRDMSSVKDYFIQCAAYAEAHNHLHDTDIRTLVIFMVSRDLKFDVFVVEPDEYPQIAAEWAGRVEKYLL